MGLLFYNSFIFPFFVQIISCKILYFAEIFPVKVPVFSQRPGRTPDNISTLQNLKKIVTVNLMRRGVLQCFRASRQRFPVSDIPTAIARAPYISDR